MLEALKNIRRTKDARKVITKAADLLEAEPERWQKGKWIITPSGEDMDEAEYWKASCDVGGVCKVCLEGALLIFAKNEDTYEEAEKLVLAELQENHKAKSVRLFGPPVEKDIEQPFQYNDSDGVGVKSVVKVLRAAAKRKAS